MYIEPCCIDRQLPQLLSGRDDTRFFQTSGDVTAQKFLQASSRLAGNGDLVMLLVMPEVNVELLRMVHYYFTRGWVTSLLLLTHDDQQQIVREELPEVLDHVQYACDPLTVDTMMAFLSQPDDDLYRRALVIQGPMLLATDYSLSLYVASCRLEGHGKAQMWTDATAAVMSKLRVKPVIKATSQATKAALEWG